jgi:hypothetical protein
MGRSKRDLRYAARISKLAVPGWNPGDFAKASKKIGSSLRVSGIMS